MLPDGEAEGDINSWNALPACPMCKQSRPQHQEKVYRQRVRGTNQMEIGLQCREMVRTRGRCLGHQPSQTAASITEHRLVIKGMEEICVCVGCLQLQGTEDVTKERFQ